MGTWLFKIILPFYCIFFFYDVFSVYLSTFCRWEQNACILSHHVSVTRGTFKLEQSAWKVEEDYDGFLPIKTERDFLHHDNNFYFWMLHRFNMDMTHFKVHSLFCDGFVFVIGIDLINTWNQTFVQLLTKCDISYNLFRK